jgi:two-component system OmpR family sensor kinase
VRVTLQAPDDGGVQCAVSDTGCGIVGAELPFIFDRFYRGDGGRRHGGGAGLGLAITKRILDLHGQGINVDSAPGRGTTFRFALVGARVKRPGAAEP